MVATANTTKVIGNDTFEIVREWAGWSRNPQLNIDKIYSTAYSRDGYLLRMWGRRGTKYQVPPGGPENYGNEQAAARAFDALVASKRSSRPSTPNGYQEVSFNDINAGSIPSWRSGAGAPGPAATETISRDNLLRQIGTLGQRLFQAGADLAALLMEVTQVELKATLFTQFAADPGERHDVAAAIITLRAHVTRRLTSC